MTVFFLVIALLGMLAQRSYADGAVFSPDCEYW